MVSRLKKKIKILIPFIFVMTITLPIVCSLSGCSEAERKSTEISKQADNWYEIYCRIAISLAKQGYIVFTSSHRVVVEEFMRRHNTNDNYVIVVVTPSSNLENEWVEKLKQRWLDDQSNEKNFIAYEDANENFQNEVIWLASQNVFPYIPILSTDYVFSNIVNGICRIYRY